MKRLLIASLLVLALLVGTWGCDVSGLATPTPVAPTSTPTIPPTSTTIPSTETPTTFATATFTLTSTPQATSTPADTATPTIEPTDTPTSMPEVFPTNTEAPEPSPIPYPSEDTPTPFDSGPEPTRLTSTPKPTRTPGGPTPTLAVLPPTAVPAETPPRGGWAEVVRVPPGKHRIALTFDAGGTGDTIPAILNTLRSRNIHITMFITGKFAEQYPDGVRQMVADGNEIANHTYSHLDSKTLTDDQLAEELARTEGIFQSLIGISTKPYWRPPYGSRNNHVLNVAVSQGYRSIYWTLDSLDSVGQPKTADFIFNRVTNTPGVDLDGAIVLQHFGSEASAEALPRELDYFQAMGLQVVTISQLISP